MITVTVYKDQVTGNKIYNVHVPVEDQKDLDTGWGTGLEQSENNAADLLTRLAKLAIRQNPKRRPVIQ